MDFTLSEKEQAFRQMVREFMRRECPKEYVRQIDEEGRFPYELCQKWAKAGWYAIPFPPEYGGQGAGAAELVILGEEISYQGGYDLAGAYVTPVFCALNIVRHGTPEQKSYFVPGLINGELLFSISMTEPNAGSDAAAITTTAVPDGDDFLINGQKVFTSGADAQNNYLHITTRTDRQAEKHRGLTVFIVSTKAPGIEIRRLKTIGSNIIGVCEIFLRDVRVPRSSILGELHQGWKSLMSNLELERLSVSSCYVGNAQAVVDNAMEWAKKRVQFGQPIGKFQVISHMLADIQTEVEAARLLVYRAASLIDKGIPCFKEVSMAKLFGSETFVKATNCGMQIMGGYGYLKDYDMERHYRESRRVTITAGASQIQRNIIARFMGL